MKFYLLLISVVLSCLPQTGFAQDEKTVLDLLPVDSEADIAVVWPKFFELGPKLDKFVDGVNPGTSSFMRPYIRSEFARVGFDFKALESSKMIDGEKSGGFIFGGLSSTFVLPVGDLAEIAENQKIDVDEIVPGEIVMTSSKNFIRIHDGFIHATKQASELNHIHDVESASARVKGEHAKPFLESDFVLLVSRSLTNQLMPILGLGWIDDVDFSEKELLDLAEQAASEFEFALAGVNIEDGLGIRMTAFFDQSKQGIQKLVASLRGGDGASNLDCLPDGNFIAALGARGTGLRNSSAAKLVLKSIIDRASPNEEVLTAKDKIEFYKRFGEIWKKLNGTRASVYQIDSEEPKDGAAVGIAIFDVDDPATLLAQLPDLVKFANESAERNSLEQDYLPIRFSYESKAIKVNGIAADILQIDTQRLDEKSRQRFRLIFGQQAKKIKLVPTKNHLIMMIGTNETLLTKTIENLAKNAPGLSSNPLIVQANTRIDARRKIELHACVANLQNFYEFKWLPDAYVAPAEIASLAMTLDPERVGFDLWIPTKDLSERLAFLW